MTYILGISAYYHDSAVALLKEGKIISAVQEERFTRKKHDARFPHKSIEYILKSEKINLNEIDYIVFYDKPFLKFERLLETYLATIPKGFQSFRQAMPIWLREKLFLKNLLTKELKKFDKKYQNKNLLFTEHHLSHAASAFYSSPFDNALVLTIDGVGEWATMTVAIGKNKELKIVKEIHYPHSLGLLYSAFTYYIGFKVNSGEYKLMGLAPYGSPKYKKLILEKLIDVKEDGSFRLNQSYFNYSTGLTMTNKKFSELFGQPVRNPEIDKLEQFHMDIASSIQSVVEEIILKITNSLSKEYNISNLCMAGGVALNCVANGKILRNNNYKNVWIQPASGDAGGALGSALAAWHLELGKKREINLSDSMQGSYLGPAFNDSEILETLKKNEVNFSKHSQDELIEITANEIANGKAIGWFQGRMEFGPRALGNRSIIADPRSETMQKNLNLKIKFRESFRPFAPSVLREDLSDWFDLDYDSPYMLFVADVKKNIRCELKPNEQKLFGIEKLNIARSKIPAITHVDYSARIQTVHKETNPLYHALISKFKELTNCPIIVNTSFNIRGEPIVCTPDDALKCFMGTHLELLVIGNYIIRKDIQKESFIKSHKERYELD